MKANLRCLYMTEVEMWRDVNVFDGANGDKMLERTQDVFI